MKSLITTLSDAKDAMSSADDALKSASPQDLGSAGLDSAGGAFRDKWTYGIGKLADLSKDMATGLQQTEKAYQDVEDGIAQAFDKAAAGAAGAVGAGAAASVAGGAGAAASGAQTTVSPISERLSGGVR
jgi:uncharacterized protein YukE